MLQDELRRFFYRMKVTSADGQHVLELPESILRLISEVTISESSYSDSDTTYPSLTVTLNETLYSPAPGAILDLRFDTEKGFSYVSKTEMESGTYRSGRDANAQAAPVIFVFGGNNRIEIEWGLLEPARISRKREFTIQTTTMSGGSSGHGTVTITAMDGTLQARKTNVDRGIHWADPIKHYSLKQVLWFVTRTLNVDLHFDGVRVNELPPFTTTYVGTRTEAGGDTAPPDPSTPIVQPKGMNFHDFVKDLANEYSSAYEFGLDPITNRETLYFTYRGIRYKDVANVFTYKSTADTVINYKIDSVEGMFNPISGASSVTDGGQISNNTTAIELVRNDVKTNGKAEKSTDKIPVPANPADVSRTKDTLDRNYVGQSVTTPAKTEDAVTNEAESLYSKNKYNTSIALTTLGHPNYRPGLILMQNIGRRYSKKYSMFTVQHKLGSSGYQCSWSGLSHYDTDAGVNADDAAKQNQPTERLKLVDLEN